jgi:hypothetical protein
MAEPDKSFRQVGCNPLRAAVESRRNALDQRSDLCDFHGDPHPLGAPNAQRDAKFHFTRIKIGVSGTFGQSEIASWPRLETSLAGVSGRTAGWKADIGAYFY